MQKIEVTHRTGAKVASEWGSEPNLRAEIKTKLATQLAMRLRLEDLIDFVVTTESESGDTIITASILAARTGDEG